MATTSWHFGTFGEADCSRLYVVELLAYGVYVGSNEGRDIPPLCRG
jgi:hypothetical protein